MKASPVFVAEGTFTLGILSENYIVIHDHKTGKDHYYVTCSQKEAGA